MGSDDVRRAAARVQQIGDDLRRLTMGLAEIETVPWRSAAATAFRHRLSAELLAVTAIAAGAEVAAQALIRHAVAVDRGADRLAPGVAR